MRVNAEIIDIPCYPSWAITMLQYEFTEPERLALAYIVRREIDTNRYPLVPQLDVDELAEIAIELRRPHISLRIDSAKGVDFPIGNLQPCRVDNSDFCFT